MEPIETGLWTTSESSRGDSDRSSSHFIPAVVTSTAHATQSRMQNTAATTPRGTIPSRRRGDSLLRQLSMDDEHEHESNEGRHIRYNLRPRPGRSTVRPHPSPNQREHVDPGPSNRLVQNHRMMDGEVGANTQHVYPRQPHTEDGPVIGERSANERYSSAVSALMTQSEWGELGPAIAVAAATSLTSAVQRQYQNQRMSVGAMNTSPRSTTAMEDDDMTSLVHGREQQQEQHQQQHQQQQQRNFDENVGTTMDREEEEEEEEEEDKDMMGSLDLGKESHWTVRYE